MGVNIPVLAWSTPWTLLGGRLQFLAAAPQVAVGVADTDFASGMYNPYLAKQLAWDLGNNFGFSYALGAYLRVHNEVAFNTSSLNQRFALSYTGNNWNLTANAIWGIQQHSVTDGVDNPDFLNIDLTATKKFDKWEIGPVGFYSTDLNRPTFDYDKQSPFALGGLVGYNFGPVTLQAYVTTDVWEKNYGGRDTRGWVRVIILLGNPFAAPEPVIK